MKNLRRKKTGVVYELLRTVVHVGSQTSSRCETPCRGDGAPFYAFRDEACDDDSGVSRRCMHGFVVSLEEAGAQRKRDATTTVLVLFPVLLPLLPGVFRLALLIIEFDSPTARTLRDPDGVQS